MIMCNMCTSMVGGCGYSHVLGENFSKIYFPVMSNIKFHTQLLVIIHFGFSAKVVNVKTAFLYGDLEEEIYVE